MNINAVHFKRKAKMAKFAMLHFLRPSVFYVFKQIKDQFPEYSKFTVLLASFGFQTEINDDVNKILVSNFARFINDYLKKTVGKMPSTHNLLVAREEIIATQMAIVAKGFSRNLSIWHNRDIHNIMVMSLQKVSLQYINSMVAFINSHHDEFIIQAHELLPVYRITLGIIKGIYQHVENEKCKAIIAKAIEAKQSYMFNVSAKAKIRFLMQHIVRDRHGIGTVMNERFNEFEIARLVEIHQAVVALSADHYLFDIALTEENGINDSLLRRQNDIIKDLLASGMPIDQIFTSAKTS